MLPVHYKCNMFRDFAHFENFCDATFHPCSRIFMNPRHFWQKIETHLKNEGEWKYNYIEARADERRMWIVIYRHYWKSFAGLRVANVECLRRVILKCVILTVIHLNLAFGLFIRVYIHLFEKYLNAYVLIHTCAKYLIKGYFFVYNVNA